MSDELLAILDSYLSQLIEDIVYKYDYDVDLEEEYDELLNYILKRIVKAWFNGRTPSPSELRKALEAAMRRRKHLEILLSYFISRYTARRGRVYVKSSEHD